MVPHRRLAVLVAVAALAFGACGPTPLAAPSDGPTAGASPSPAGAAPTCAPASTKADPVAAGRSPWARDIAYEVFVRSFADSNGDGIGDLAGLTAHLDALNDGDPATTTDLGVTALWLMPVAKSNSYHGYDVVDYTAIEPDYGTADDMRALTSAAHARGIKVIVDFVPNHTSSENPWFLDAQTPGSAHRDWYVWSDTDPGWPPVAGGNPWHPRAGAYFYGAFWEGMPDLNLRNPAVTTAITDAALVWLSDYGVDGFRIDAAKHLIEDDAKHQTNTPETKAWLAAFRTAIHAVKPEALVIGEVWDPRGISSGYTTDGSLDMTFDFGMGDAILSGAGGDGTTLRVNQAEVATRYAPGLGGTFLANHDQPRVMTTLRGDVASMKVAATLLLTGPGVPFLYYGEELGLVGGKPDENIRRPYPWTAVGPGYGFTTGAPWEAFGIGAETANVETESADPDSLLSTYRDLIRLRTAYPALADGSFSALETSDSHVVAAIRADDTERLLVISNLGDEALAGVSLSADASALCGPPIAAEMVYPAGSDAKVSLPVIDAVGGFSAWVALASVPAHATVVVRLTP